MPDDPTPLGDAMTHRFTQQQIPQPKPGEKGGTPAANEATDISRRPSLPVHPTPMAADLNDRDQDLDKQEG